MQRLNAIMIFSLLTWPPTLLGQTRISISTDISVQRSLKKEQRFWAFGQDVVVHWHFTPKNGSYASVSYYSNGNFKNPLSAPAKSLGTSPAEIFFTNKAKIRLVQISLGWRRYLVGTNNAEGEWNLYAITGFGLIFGKATNVYSITIDTSLYSLPPQPINGIGYFKRLTLDLGLGWEIPLGGEIYFYSEGKIWIPTTEYPSRYLFINNNAPLVMMATAGLRILL